MATHIIFSQIVLFKSTASWHKYKSLFALTYVSKKSDRSPAPVTSTATVYLVPREKTRETLAPHPHRVIDQRAGHRADEFPVLNDRAAAHERLSSGTTVFFLILQEQFLIGGVFQQKKCCTGMNFHYCVNQAAQCIEINRTIRKIVNETLKFHNRKE